MEIPLSVKFEKNDIVIQNISEVVENVSSTTGYRTLFIKGSSLVDNMSDLGGMVENPFGNITVLDANDKVVKVFSGYIRFVNLTNSIRLGQEMFNITFLDEPINDSLPTEFEEEFIPEE